MIRRLHTPLPTRWRDAAVAASWLVALEVESLTTSRHLGSTVANALLVGVMGAAAIWRRRAPLAFVTFVLGCGTVLAAAWSSNSVVVAPLFVLVLPPYTAAKEGSRERALLGLIAVLVWAVATNAATSANATDYLVMAVIVGAAWGAGRWLRARRLLNEELAHNAQRIEAERASRISLAVADERTRIARELHTVVAANVSAMVIQAEAAELLLHNDARAADEAMAAVEQTGRDALSDMRRLLGILRHSGDAPTLLPQPGVGELYALVEAARSTGRAVELRVEGEPRPLPAGVDLGIYRMVEEALTTVDAGDTLIRLQFSQDQIDLEACVSDPNGAAWPTLAMRERAAICNGSIRSDASDDRRRLLVSFPRSVEEAFA